MTASFRAPGLFSRWFVRLVLAALAILVTLVAGLQTLEKEPVLIGAILSLSGPAGHLESVRDGMLLALEEENRRGGVQDRPLELVIEDSQTDPGAAVRAFDRMEARSPAVYFATNSRTSIAVGERAEARQAVLVSLVSASEKVYEEKEWVYTFWPRAQDEVAPMRKITALLEAEGVGLLFPDDAFGRSISSRLAEVLKADGRQLVSFCYPRGTRDFRPGMASLLDQKALILIGFVGQLKEMIRQARELGYPGHLIGTSGTVVLHISEGPDLTQGVYAPVPAIYNPRFPFVRSLKEKYETRYGRPITHQAAAGYESLKIIAGLLRFHGVERSDLKAALDQGFIHQGSLGEIYLAPGGHQAGFDLYPARFERERIRFLRQ